MTMVRLTQVPLPDWDDLLNAVFNPSFSNEELAKPWCRTGDEGLWFSRSSWSLAALAQWRQRVSSKQTVTVWLPDYFCNVSLVPLRAMGMDLLFYPITAQMSPDWTVCKALAPTQPPDIFVLVHYFGQPSPTEDAVAFCQDSGAWLIEDAAHVLQPIAGVGEAGDCVLYSPHKHLPIPDGAVLVVRKKGPACPGPVSHYMRELSMVHSKLNRSGGRSDHTTWFWLVKRLLQRLGIRSRKKVPAFRDGASADTAIMSHPAMSGMAKRLLSRLVTSLDGIAYIRRRNAQVWRERIPAIVSKACQVVPVLSETTPYLSIFAGNTPSEVEQTFLLLQKAGLPVTTWPDLPPEVSENRMNHAVAVALRESRFFLPVHQSLAFNRVSW